MKAFKKKVALIGCGYWGSKICNAILNHKKIQLIYIVEKNIKNIKKKNIKNIQIVQDYRNINLFDIDAVLIATPVKTHFEIAKYFLTNNKSVFVEKPITINLNDFKKLSNLAKKNNITLMSGDLYLYHPAINVIKKIIHNNELGKIKFINFNRLNNGIVRSDLSLAENLASHDLSILFYIFKNLKVNKIFKVKHFILSLKKYDYFQGIINFKNNLNVALNLSWCNPSKVRNISFFGSKKSLHFDDLNPNKILITNRLIINNKDKIKKIGSSKIINIKSNTKPLDNEIDYFYKCIVNKKTPRSSEKLLINILETLKKINKN